MYPIITISREFGSGGHSVGQKVAEELGIPFYDSELVDQVAKRSGYTKAVINEQGEYTDKMSKCFPCPWLRRCILRIRRMRFLRHRRELFWTVQKRDRVSSWEDVQIIFWIRKHIRH